MSHIHSISLYRNTGGSKAFVLPYPQRTSGPLHHATNPLLRQAQKILRDGGCRIKFNPGHGIWKDYQHKGVTSRGILMDLVAVMQKEGKQLLCCANLNIRGPSAGTFFFQNHVQEQSPSSLAPPQPEMACLQLEHHDKICIIQLPESEVQGLGNTITRHWTIPSLSNNYGCRGYRLEGYPWKAVETTNSTNIDAHKLMIKMLRYMSSNGWNQVVPFDCSIGSSGADSLLFFRDQSNWQVTNQHQDQEFCAISLEKEHKIRLIGCSNSVLDEASLGGFERAIRQHCQVTECNKFCDNIQIMSSDRLWRPYTTIESIKSAKLMCAVLQGLCDQGWRWQCAIDMSVSLADKSSFFLSRSRGRKEHNNGGEQVGCLLPKGQNKVNLVSFPPTVLSRVIASIEKTPPCGWGVKHVGVQRLGPDSATIVSDRARLHCTNSTTEKTLAAHIYTQLLTIIVGTSGNGITMLGSADISAHYKPPTEHQPQTYSLDTDAFFFSFQNNCLSGPLPVPANQAVTDNSHLLVTACVAKPYGRALGLGIGRTRGNNYVVKYSQGPFAETGLREGMLILQINGAPLENLSLGDVHALFSNTSEGGAVTVLATKPESGIRDSSLYVAASVVKPTAETKAGLHMGQCSDGSWKIRSLLGLFAETCLEVGMRVLRVNDTPLAGMQSRNVAHIISRAQTVTVLAMREHAVATAYNPACNFNPAYNPSVAEADNTTVTVSDIIEVRDGAHLQSLPLALAVCVADVPTTAEC